MPVSPRFQRAYLEITSVCNLQCSFCPPTRRAAEFLSVERFRHVVAQLAPFTRHLHLHVKGEPLLHPALGELLDAAHEAGLAVTLVTNGTLLGDRAGLLLSHPAVHRVNVSLHSWKGGSPGAEAYLDPIVAFVRRAEATGRLISVLRFWAKPDPVLLGLVEAALPRNGNRLGAHTFLDFDQPFEWPSLTAPLASPRAFCLGLRDQVAILVDGTVVPCCLDGEGVIDLGNVFEQDFSSILNGPRAQALHRGFSEHRCAEPLCARCGFRERFSGRTG